MRQRSILTLVNTHLTIQTLRKKLNFVNKMKQRRCKHDKEQGYYNNEQKVSKYQKKKLKAGEKPPKPDLTGRAKIIRGRNVPRQARADLKALNEAMAENRLNAQLLESLPTKFFSGAVSWHTLLNKQVG